MEDVYVWLISHPHHACPMVEMKVETNLEGVEKLPHWMVNGIMEPK